MKSEILQTIAETCAQVCEVSVEDIRSLCKRGDMVEARCIFVHYCYAYGLQPSSILQFLRRKRKASVNDYSSNYLILRRQSTSFRLMSDQVGQKLSALFP